MNEKGLPRGYTVPTHLKREIKQYAQTSLGISTATACTDLALLVLCMALGPVSASYGWGAWLALHACILWPPAAGLSAAWKI